MAEERASLKWANIHEHGSQLRAFKGAISSVDVA